MKAVQRLLGESAYGSDENVGSRQRDSPEGGEESPRPADDGRNNEAWFALEFEGNEFEFSGPEEILTCAQRIDEKSLHESTETISGTLQGVMSRRRMFELQPFDGSLIEGRLGPEIRDAPTLLRQYLDRPVTAMLYTVRVGKGTPKYTLNLKRYDLSNRTTCRLPSVVSGDMAPPKKSLMR